MTVRPATIADIPALQAISRANPTAPQWTEAQFHDTLQPHPNSSVQRQTVVAVVENQIAGFAIVSALTAVFPVEAELESVAVHPTLHGKGIGRALLTGVFTWCRAQGAHILRLEVRASNVPAIALYERTGFHTEGTRPGYYSSPVEDALCMALSFSSTETE